MTSENEKPFVIAGGRVIDPANGIDAPMDLLIRGERIEAIDKPGSFSKVAEAEVVSAGGQLVVPGLVDVHVHLREPGFEWKETVESGARAAVAGGYTRICCMPNTNPVNDRASVTEYILNQSKMARSARILPIGAISVGSKSEALAPMLELREAGCVAFSDDGQPVSHAGLMRRALEYSLMCEAVLCCHEEEKSLCPGFAMNESAMSVRMGLSGMPDAAENVMISRDIELARLTGARVHFCHVTTARGVVLIERAKSDGIPVTAEVTPHHITLDESAVEGFQTNAKMSPPLRKLEDVEAVLDGLKRGVLDCVACDHAPHEADSKNREFQEASFGIIGLQTNVPLVLAKVRNGSLSLLRAIESLTSSPASCLRLNPAVLSKGALADIAIIDMDRRWNFSKEQNLSKSANSPFFGWEMQGLVTRTFVGGREVYAVGKSFSENVVNMREQ